MHLKISSAEWWQFYLSLNMMICLEIGLKQLGQKIWLLQICIVLHTYKIFSQCFCHLIWSYYQYLPIFFRITSPALGQFNIYMRFDVAFFEPLPHNEPNITWLFWDNHMIATIKLAWNIWIISKINHSNKKLGADFLNLGVCCIIHHGECLEWCHISISMWCL